MCSAVENTETLFTEVGLVQNELDKFGAKKVVDANEIYELLEIHSYRNDRIQYVASHFLLSLGLKYNMIEEDDDEEDADSNGDVIDISDDSNDMLDDFHYSLSPEYNAPPEPDVSEFVLHGIGYIESYGPETGENRPTNTVTVPPVLPVVEVHHPISLSEVKTSHSFAEGMVEIMPSKNGNGISEVVGKCMFPEKSCQEACTSKVNCDQNTSIAVVEDTRLKIPPTSCSTSSTAVHISSPALQCDDFMYDVNNNDPNNNTDYEAPLQTEDKREESHSDTNDIDDVGTEFQDQEDIRCKLIEEARLIHRIVPRQNLEQIYSYLEANMDMKNRVQIVMREFLTMELASENNSNIACSTLKKSDEDSKSSESQPSTSSVSKVNRMELVRLDSQPSTSSKGLKNTTDKDSMCNTPVETTCKVQDEKQSIGQTVDSEHNGTKLYLGEVSSTSVTAPHFENSSTLVGEVNITSTSNLGRQTITGTGDHIGHDALDFSSSERERNKDNVENIDLDEAVFPEVESTSTAGMVTGTVVLDSVSEIETHKRKSESLDEESSPEKKRKIKDTETKMFNLTPQQLKYKSTLMEMFPDADPQYLKELCQNMESGESLEGVVSKLLEDNTYPKRQILVFEPQPSTSTATDVPESDYSIDKIEAQYQTLLAILPNADPGFLRARCEQIGNDEDAMKTFVTKALETKDYPTREDYLKRQEALAVQERYTKEFSVESFLEIFPDPVKYFTKEKKNDKNIAQHALAYLKRRYKRICNADLNKIFKEKHYSLTKTCISLESFKGKLRKNKRSEYECRFPAEVNIPFLQEVAFIENKEKIKDYLKEKAVKKKKAFDEAKANGDLLECGCCFDNEVMTEDVATCNEGHIFCKECVRQGAEVQIGSGKTAFPCLTTCDAEFSLKTLQSVLKPSVFSKMLQRKQLEEVKAAGIDGLETCPFCDFANIPPCEDKVFRCLNPECMRESCRNCKEPNHIPLRCEEVEKSEEVKMRTYIEDRMTEALVRTCWQCQKKFIKEEGCNKMICTCGASMCYLCRQPVRDYSHFNGQGGDNYHKCPLYSKNETLHEEAVIKEAEKAKEEVKAQHPELSLKHDPTQMFPKNTKQRGQKRAERVNHYRDMARVFLNLLPAERVNEHMQMVGFPPQENPYNPPRPLNLVVNRRGGRIVNHNLNPRNVRVRIQYEVPQPVPLLQPVQNRPLLPHPPEPVPPPQQVYTAAHHFAPPP